MQGALLAWYDASRRSLPWRLDNSFYRVWLSEIMLQQTRVEAVIPYFERFLGRFPDVATLACAAEEDVLACWSGLGYYSRARNLHRAARQMLGGGQPTGYQQISELPGIGPYTSAAIASIALGLAHAAVDGNVMRVVSRLWNDPSEISAGQTKRTFAERAQELLDPLRPGDFNQAMMELGATVCVPKVPRCDVCPVAEFCAARGAGTQSSLPVKLGKAPANMQELHLALIHRATPQAAWFLVRRDTAEKRLAGFWELPEKKLFPKLRVRRSKSFVHQIVNDRFRVTVWSAKPPAELPEGSWFGREELNGIPLATISRKAIDCVEDADVKDNRVRVNVEK